MHKIDAPNATPGDEFTDGDPGTGIVATEVWSKWLNTIQRELVAIVEEAGISLDDEVDDQVLAAVQILFGAFMEAAGPKLVTNANGNPTISDVPFDAASNVPVTEWRSVGPTGSGAANIWTALDDLPDGVAWITVRFIAGGTGAAGSQSDIVVRARKTGSSHTADSTNAVAASRGNGECLTIVSHPIPVNAAKCFDINWLVINVTTVTVDLYLIGHGPVYS